MTYLLPTTLGKVTVQVNAEGQPTVFYWRRQEHQIMEISNQYRVDDGWWEEHIKRDYYEVTTKTVLFAVLYHDLHSDEWRLEQVSG